MQINGAKGFLFATVCWIGSGQDMWAGGGGRTSSVHTLIKKAVTAKNTGAPWYPVIHYPQILWILGMQS